MFRMYVSLEFLAMSLGVSPLLVSCVFGCLFTISLSSVGQLCLSLPQSPLLVSCVFGCLSHLLSLSLLLVSCVFGCLSLPPSLSSVGQLCLWVSFPSTISLLCWSAVSLGVFPFHHLSPLLVSCVFGCLSLPPSLSSVGRLCLWVSFPSTISLLSALPPSLSHSPHLLPPPPCTSFLICWLCCGSADKETRMYLWWSLCPLYLHACQVRVT